MENQNGDTRAGQVSDSTTVKPPVVASGSDGRDWDAEHQQRQRLLQVDSAMMRLKSDVGRRYHDCTLNNFEIANDAAREAKEQSLAAVRNYANNISDRIKGGQGLAFVGPRGTGKDHLLAACMWLAIRSLHTVRWVDGQSLFQQFREVIRSDGDEAELLAEFTRPDVLAISDPMPLYGSVTEFQQSALWRIIDRRYRMRRPIWLTMNVSDRKEAESRLGDQIVDRLFDDAVVIQCRWPSYRSPATV